VNQRTCSIRVTRCTSCRISGREWRWRASPRRCTPAAFCACGILVYSFEPAEAAGRLNAWLAAAPNDPAQGWTADELAAHIRGEYSTYSWLLEPMLERVGFDIIHRAYSPSQTFAAYVCVRA
jgi:hypothetical protein